jgi:hypothetical protein
VDLNSWMRISRRAALISLGGAVGVLGLSSGGLALVDAELLPGKSALNKVLGRCDGPIPAPALRGSPQPPVIGSFRSAARRREVYFAISYPPGYGDGSKLPVCLALHGCGSDGRAGIDAEDYPQFIAVPFGMARRPSRMPPQTAVTGIGTGTRPTIRWAWSSMSSCRCSSPEAFVSTGSLWPVGRWATPGVMPVGMLTNPGPR